MQEIKNTAFDSNGNSIHSTTDTYIYDPAKGFVFNNESVVDATYGVNNTVATKTTVLYGSSTVLTYSGANVPATLQTSLTPLTKTVEHTTGSDMYGNVTGETINNYTYSSTIGNFAWTSLVTAAYTYECHGFITSSNLITSVDANQASGKLNTAPPATLVNTTQTITDMRQATLSAQYCVGGAIQYFDAFGNAKYQITKDYNWISGAWQQTDAVYKQITSIDSTRGRVMGYSDVVDQFVNGSISIRTTDTVTLGYDNANRVTSMNDTSVSKDFATNGGVLNITSTMNKTNITYNSLNQATGWQEVSTSSDAPDKEVHETVSGVTYDIYGQMKDEAQSVTEQNRAGSRLRSIIPIPWQSM